MVEWDLETFKKLFPNLYKEIVEGKMSVSIDSVRTSAEEAEKTASVPKNPIYPGFTPGAIDFIRRCSSEQEALEVIDYLERTGEITEEYANKLRQQLKEKGLRSFGPKKEYGYYQKFYLAQKKDSAT